MAKKQIKETIQSLDLENLPNDFASEETKGQNESHKVIAHLQE